MAMLLVLSGSAYAETTISISAIQATGQGSGAKQLDDASKTYQRLLSDLPYTNFKEMKHSRVSTQPTKEHRVQIGTRYTAYLSVADRSEGTRVNVNVRITVTSRTSGKTVTAVESNLRLAQDKPVLIRGLKIEDGELLVVLNLD